MTQLDQLFHALSDTTRRAVVARLGRGSGSVGELAKPFDMALPSFMQHLNVLEKSGLIRSKKIGRVRIYKLAPKRLDLVNHWLEEQHLQWKRRLDQLDDYLTKGE
jgi:DNA-binding transcriptional ArsR family regulator